MKVKYTEKLNFMVSKVLKDRLEELVEELNKDSINEINQSDVLRKALENYLGAN